MRTNRKFSYKYLSAGIVGVFVVTWAVASVKPGHFVGAPVTIVQEFSSQRVTAPLDTVPLKKDTGRVPVSVSDTSRPADSLHLVTDTVPRFKVDSVQRVDTLRVPMSKDSLEAPIDYEADDSMVLFVKTKQIFLYNKATTKYKDLNLQAGVIMLDQGSQILTAFPIRDTVADTLSQKPVFSQGESKFVADSMRYNMKTQKGMILNSYTQSGEMFIYSQRTKKISQNSFYAANARFTTCNLDTPHFAFRSKKVKYISGKMAITGWTRPEFEGIPFPIGIPWGIFPLYQGRHSGLLAPSFTTNEQYGLGLEGLGYYKVINDNFDFQIRTNIYSYGSWQLTMSPTYYKRYHYKGSVNVNILNTKIAFKGDPDYSKSTNFNVQWSHSVDSKARPGQTFAASVNFATSKYNQYVTNNPVQNYTNQMQSSIAYTKTWTGTPFYLSLAASHNQNTTQRLMNITLPDAAFTMNTVYPFQKKDFVGTKKWYENLGIGYSGSARSLVSFYDTAFSMHQLLDTLQWGAHHSVPIQLSLPAMGPLQLSPSISYDETWYSRQFFRSNWNQNGDSKIDTSIQKGFFAARQVSFGLSASTAIFGTYNFKHGKVKGLHHVIRPTLGFSYKPDMTKGQYYSIKIDSLGNTSRFSKYDGAIYSAYSEGTFGGITFGIDNNLEMKVRDKSDTSANGLKKVKLIDGFGLTGSYNLVADSFKMSDFSLYARSNLFDKFNISAGANLSPYQVDSRGVRIDKYAWAGGKPTLGRLTSAYASVTTSFTSKKAKDASNAETDQVKNGNVGMPQTLDEQMQELQYIRNNPAEYADFNIPWNLNLSYSLSMTRSFKADYSGYQTKLTQSLSFNGDFNLTEKWKIIANGVYNFDTHKLQYLQTSLARDLHCWQLSLNITPIGINRSFTITISPKSSILRDLRINRTKTFYSSAY